MFAKERPDVLRDSGNEPPPEVVREGMATENPPMVGGEEERSGLEIGIDPIQQIPAMHLDTMTAVPKSERARMGEAELSYAARTFTHNVRKIVKIARRHGTPVVLLNPAANDFQDPAWFPYGGEDGEAFNTLVDDANRAMEEGRTKDTLRLINEAIAMHPQDPRAAFAKAQALSMSGQRDQARPLYDLARSRAEYPNRVVPPVSQAIRDFEGLPGVLGVIDAEQLFREKSDGGLIGYDLIYDHCHPSGDGNYLIAGALAKLLLGSDLPAMQQAKDMDIDAWVAQGQEALERRSSADPRLWEWTGLDYEGKRGGGKYIADFQGDWSILRDELLERARTEDATGMDLLWAGNARFYDYKVDAALRLWDEAIRRDPTLCLAHANRAHALRMMGLRDQALADASAAVVCEPANEEFGAMRDLLVALTK